MKAITQLAEFALVEGKLTVAEIEKLIEDGWIHVCPSCEEPQTVVFQIGGERRAVCPCMFDVWEFTRADPDDPESDEKPRRDVALIDDVLGLLPAFAEEMEGPSCEECGGVGRFCECDQMVGQCHRCGCLTDHTGCDCQ